MQSIHPQKEKKLSSTKDARKLHTCFCELYELLWKAVGLIDNTVPCINHYRHTSASIIKIDDFYQGCVVRGWQVRHNWPVIVHGKKPQLPHLGTPKEVLFIPDETLLIPISQ